MVDINITDVTVGDKVVTTGLHDTDAAAAILKDSGAAWDVNGFIGRTVKNITDGSEAVVISNTATTIVATLLGGTNNYWSIGDTYLLDTGTFDKLMNAVDIRVKEEWEANRITGVNYATVYLGAMEAAMAQSVQFTLGKDQSAKQNELMNQKIATEEAQTLDTTTTGSTPGAVVGMIGKQKLLLAKQTDGFDRDAEQKAAKMMLDSYAVRRSTDSAAPPPQRAEDEDIDAFIEVLYAGLGAGTLPDTYTISGTIIGYSPSINLVIQNNLGDSLPISVDGNFEFPAILNDLATYSVTILSPPDTPAPTTTTITGGDSPAAGTDDTSSAAAFLTDSTAAWTINEFVGRRLQNVTDGSETIVTSNTATTITGVLAGGGSNDWNSGESYIVGDDGKGTIAAADVNNIVITFT